MRGPPSSHLLLRRARAPAPDSQDNVEAQIKKGGRMEGTFRRRRERALSALPSPLEFYSYIYHFASLIAGPALLMRQYLSAMNGAAFVDRDGKPLPAGQTPPGRVRAAFTQMGLGLLYMAIFVGLTPLCDSSRVHLPETLALPTLH